MNRFIFIPGMVLVGVSFFAYFNQAKVLNQEQNSQDVAYDPDLAAASIVEGAEGITYPGSFQIAEAPVGENVKDSELMSWKDAKRTLLKDWPVDLSMAGASRGGQSRSFSASVFDLAENWADDEPIFLTTFNVYLKGQDSDYPVCVDRAKNLIYIHSKRRWHDYDSWKTENLPRFVEQAEGRTGGGARGGGGRGGDIRGGGERGGGGRGGQ